MKNYKELKVWKKSMGIVEDLYQLITLLPDREKYGLSMQIIRSGISIPSNIAEGSSRSGDKEYSRFLEISLGSSFELETQLLIVQRAYPKIKFDIQHLISEVNEIQMMLSSFISTVRKTNG